MADAVDVSHHQGTIDWARVAVQIGIDPAGATTLNVLVKGHHTAD